MPKATRSPDGAEPPAHTCAIDGRPAHRWARLGTGYWCSACYEWSRKREWADPSERTRHATARPGAICDLDGCNLPHKALGYCTDHYRQHQTHGDPTIRVKRRHGDLETEIHAAAHASTNECIILTGFSERPRVTLASLGGKTHQASRAVWITRHGDPGPDRHVLHTCNGGSGDAGCINIRHLYLDDHARNMRDKVIAGRSLKGRTDLRGEVQGNAILTEENVLEARRLYAEGTGTRALAERYGVAQATMKDVVQRRSWRHI